MAFEETGARKGLANNTLRSTCVHHVYSVFPPAPKSINHQRPENMVDAQSSNISTVLPNLSRFPSRTSIDNVSVVLRGFVRTN